MKSRVTEGGLLIPRRLLEGVEEVDIRKEGDTILVVPVKGVADPILELGAHPVDDTVEDASERHDRHLYGRA